MSSDIIISVEKLSKKYRLGEIGATSLRESVERLTNRMRSAFRSLLSVNSCLDGSPNNSEQITNNSSVSSNNKEPVTNNKKSPSSSFIPHPSSLSSAATGGKQEPSALLHDLHGEESSDLWALKDVSFEVKRGEVLGIIGRNGAGKSTLLKILSRITEPTSGRAVMRGRVGSLLEVGTGFHPELTGRDNIYLNGAILGMRKREIDAKFDEIVDFSGVEKFIDTPVKRYSSGMYVRLAFAVAAHLDPEILLVDEVLAVGDMEFQKKCLGKMNDVAKSGRTVLFVSHNMGAISKLCPRTLLLSFGALEHLGRSEDVVSSYLMNNDNNAGLVKWPNGLANDGVTDFAFLSVVVKDFEGKAVSSVDIKREFFIEIEYEIKAIIANLQLAIGIIAADGSVLFYSYLNDSVGEDDLGKYCGKFVAHCEMPANYLNANKYFVALHAHVKAQYILAKTDSAISFSVENTGAIGPYKEQPGYLRPLLTWKCSRSGG